MRTRVQGTAVYFLDYKWEGLSGRIYTLRYENNQWLYTDRPVSLLGACAMAGRIDEEELLVMKLTYGA
jgi:hypothetical protein